MNDLINKITLGDCLEVMKRIPDKSVDLVLTDPPYNMGVKGEKWDKIANYKEWLFNVFSVISSKIKDYGYFCYWHNNVPFMAEVHTEFFLPSRFSFNSRVIWHKPNYRAKSWKTPNNTLRSFFNVCEFLDIYVGADFKSKTGLEEIYSNKECFASIKKYLREEREKWKKSSGLRSKDIALMVNALTGNTATERHCFGNSQWVFPTEKNYKALQSTGFFQREYEDLRREYEDLRREYEDLRPTFNTHANVKNIHDETPIFQNRIHPCEKPLGITNMIINTLTKKGDLVLDPFGGSGTTATTCHETGRDFIAIEKDEGYHKSSCERLERVKAQGVLFYE